MVKPSSQPADDGTERRILDAADLVFVRRGTDGARMQEIAGEAGVNKALLHYYYRTKEQLSQAVFQRAASTLLPAVIQIMASDIELEEKIERTVETYLVQLSLRPYLPGYILSELAHRPERVLALVSAAQGRIKNRALRKLRHQIERRREAGTIAPITAEQFLVTLLSACIFPFAARPLLAAVLEMGPRGFEQFIERRRRELPAFLIRALQP